MKSLANDVIVIGAGIIGGSIAWRLAQAGASVTLLDGGTLGGEASWAGAGMLAPGGEFSGDGEWARFALESLALYPAFVEELQAETGCPIDYRKCGAVEIARTDEEWQDLQSRAATQETLGLRTEPIDPPEGAVGALHYPDDALVDPRDVTRALRCACEARGVRIIEHKRALEIRVGGQCFDVDVGSGQFLGAAAGVLAAGAWSGSVAVWCDERRVEIPETFGVRGHLLGYRLEPGSLGPLMRHGHTYVMQRSSGFTIAGTTSERAGFDRTLDPAAIADIRARASALWPCLQSAGDPEAWLGFRPATADLEPRIGRVEHLPLWLAYGHYRNGILLAPATAQRVSREMGAA